MRPLSLILLLPLALAADDCDPSSAINTIRNWAEDNGYEDPYDGTCDYLSCEDYKQEVWADYTDPASCALYYCGPGCRTRYESVGACTFDDNGCVTGYSGTCVPVTGACCSGCDDPNSNHCISPTPAGCLAEDHASETSNPVPPTCAP